MYSVVLLMFIQVFESKYRYFKNGKWRDPLINELNITLANLLFEKNPG